MGTRLTEHGAIESLAKRRGPLVGVSISLLLLLGAGCKMGPDHCRPAAPMLASWSDETATAQVPDRWLGCWWLQYDDPVLWSLVESVRGRNLELQEAAWRIQEARALRGVTVGGLWPNLSARGDYATRRVSNQGNPFVVSQSSSSGFDFYSAGFDAAWELDLWGKYRRSIEAADAEVGLAGFSHADLQVSLAAEVATNYVQLRVFQQRIAVAEENARIQAETLRLTQVRQDSGLVRGLDVEQARANLHQTLATIPTLRAGATQAWNRICVLQGHPPGELNLAEGGIPTTQEPLQIGIPADLLRRRPDIRAAERDVAAQCARVGVSIAELFPQLTLTGTIGVDSRQLSRLFLTQSMAYQFGPGIHWNFWNYGRLRSNVQVQRARLEQEANRYQQTVLVALEEVESGLAEYRRERERLEQLQLAAAAARRSVQLSRSAYERGLAGFQRVLDSQRSAQNLQDELVLSQGNVALSRIALFKAVGGGW